MRAKQIEERTYFPGREVEDEQGEGKLSENRKDLQAAHDQIRFPRPVRNAGPDGRQGQQSGSKEEQPLPALYLPRLSKYSPPILVPGQQSSKHNKTGSKRGIQRVNLEARLERSADHHASKDPGGKVEIAIFSREYRDFDRRRSHRKQVVQQPQSDGDDGQPDEGNRLAASKGHP